MGTSQVPIWTVLFRRNPFFTGREEVFDQLYTELHNTSITALSQPAAMSGLGGIGKTQTAVEYAYRHRDEYQVVCWIKSSTSEELAGDFASLAQLLHLPEQQVQEQAQIIIAVKRWLETHSDWLLIFDNADDLAIIADYLPQGNTGHVIITTRASSMGGIAAKIEMHPMKRVEGIRLLLQRAKLIESTTSLEQVGEADLDTAESIFHKLGGLPLALNQAGAYIEETGESLSGYLLLFEEQRAELLQWHSGLVSDHAPVATTWTLAFHNIEDNTPAAIELMKLLAFLAPDEIPEELLTGTAHLLTPSLQALIANQTRFNEAIKALLTYSLIQRDRTSRTLSIHRLVQAVIKDELSKPKQAQWAEYIVLMISHIFPFEDHAPWTRSQRYLSHALLAVEYIKQMSFTFEKARVLLNALGIYFTSRGQYREAEALFQHYRAITEKRFGLDHLATATSLNNLAILYTRLGKDEQAEPLYLRALAIREKRVGHDHPETASSLDALAILYSKLGKYEQAEPLDLRALAIHEKRQGPDHPETATCLNNLANLYTDQSKYEQAEPLIQRALAILEKRLEPNHHKTAYFLTSQANLYTHLGRYEQAEPLYQRALDNLEKRQGSDHLDTASCLDDFANFYQVQGKYEQAKHFYLQALHIFEQRLGSDNPRTINVLNHYSQSHQII